MKKLRVLALMHIDLVPPDTISGLDKKEIAPFQAEWDVVSTLRRMGHEVMKLGLYDDLAPLRKAIDEWKPDLAFNMMEEFAGEIMYDQNVVAYLELKGVPYTGCNPRGLILSHDKALAKKILHFHRIPIPDFTVFPMGRAIRRPKRLNFPLIVKSLVADASAGISQASVVYDDTKLNERVKFIHRRLHTDAIVEEFVDGREVYVALMGNSRLRVFPPREMVFKKLPDTMERIATERVKWNIDYQKKHGITTRAASLSTPVADKLARVSKRAYRALGMSGYARMDFRLAADDRVYLIEANANAQIAKDEDFSLSAKAGGLDYRGLLRRILQLALQQARE